MTKYIFYGSVLPERANVAFSPILMTSINSDYELIAQCALSKIVVEFNCNDETRINATHKNIIEHNIRILVDSLGFSLACGYDVQIESVLNTKTHHVEIFGVHEPIFDFAQNNFHPSNIEPHPDTAGTFFDISKLAGVHLELAIALADFRESIRTPHFTSFYCYRAIEALKNALEGNDKQQWNKLHEIVSSSKEIIQPIKDKADQLRHGKFAEQSWDTRKHAMLVTWDIINKFIKWRLDDLSINEQTKQEHSEII